MGMNRLEPRAVVGGVIVGLAVAIAGLVVLVAAVGLVRGMDITDVRHAALTRRPSVQLPFLSVWLLAVLAAGRTAGALARGRPPRLHGGLVGLLGLLAALAGMSRQDPAWATALVLLLTLPVAVAGASIGGAASDPRGPAWLSRWALTAALGAFGVTTVALAASEGGVLPWGAFIVGGVLLLAAAGTRVRARPPA